jgi:hypothetical protein
MGSGSTAWPGLAWHGISGCTITNRMLVLPWILNYFKQKVSILALLGIDFVLP